MNIQHTYSIVAISEDQSQFGVAVQSHWFGVGAVCPWILSGVGVIATQSMVEISYGPKGLALMEEGLTAQKTLDILINEDNGRDLRQVAIIDASGNKATHTGSRCVAEAGHQMGKNYSVQANMMLKNTVWPAMAHAFESTSGSLAKQLFAALKAAQAERGDIRGQQSAAMLIAENISDDTPWDHLITNLRVDDHPNPLQELERLLNTEDAYRLMNEGDDLIARGEAEQAQEKYRRAAKNAPGIEELPFWEAVTLADIGKVEQALPIFKRVFEKNPDWAILVQRLPQSGLLTDDPLIMDKIMSVLKER